MAEPLRVLREGSCEQHLLGDHAHGSRMLLQQLMTCEYVHETRGIGPDGSRLTDHSGLAVRLALIAHRTLLTSDPATAVDAHNEPEPTLF